MRRLAVLPALVAMTACSDAEPRSRVCVLNPDAGKALRVLPADFVDWWVAPNSQRRFAGQVSRTDCGALAGAKVVSDQPWLVAELHSDQEAALRRLVLTVDATQLTLRSPGEDGYDQAVVRVTVKGLSAETRVRVRVIDLFEVHVGDAQGMCRRVDASGNRIDTCDIVSTRHPSGGYSMEDALQVALARYGNGGVHLLLYDSLGEPMAYDGEFTLHSDTRISAGPGVPASRVMLVAWDDISLNLAGDRIHIHDLTIGSVSGMDIAIAAVELETERATRGHLIENVTIYDYVAPTVGHSGHHTLPLLLGPDSVVRNNYIHGYFDGGIDLTHAHDSRIIGNTFVYYGDVGEPWNLAGATGLTVANNVVLSLTRRLAVWLSADGSSEFTVVGNVIEGFDRAVGGAESDQSVGEAELESPRAPLFLRDSEQRIDVSIAGEGRSMDGQDISGRLDLRPGAFQQSSELSSPRRELVRVGSSCGAQPCDISVAEPDALQQALWSVWPGGTVEIYPSASSYARAVISWGTTLLGQGRTRDIVVGADEDSWRLHHSYGPVHAALFVSPGIFDPVHVANLTLTTDVGGLVHHATIERSSHNRHLFERLIVLCDDPGSLDPAIVIGHNVVVRDVLVSGPFESCVTMGGRYGIDYAGPNDSTAWVLNLTCRLNGYDKELPETALWVGGARDALFANIVVDGPSSTALFGAQRDGDEVWSPDRFTATAISYRGITTTHHNFDPATPYVFEDVVGVSSSASFLTEDGRLQPGAHGIDRGVNPAVESSLLRFSVELGDAIDGTPRAGRVVDQGAYEQGN